MYKCLIHFNYYFFGIFRSTTKHEKIEKIKIKIMIHVTLSSLKYIFQTYTTQFNLFIFKISIFSFFFFLFLCFLNLSKHFI